MTKNEPGPPRTRWTDYLLDFHDLTRMARWGLALFIAMAGGAFFNGIIWELLPSTDCSNYVQQYVAGDGGCRSLGGEVLDGYWQLAGKLPGWLTWVGSAVLGPTVPLIAGD
jgi:hypothetical protein